MIRSLLRCSSYRGRNQHGLSWPEEGMSGAQEGVWEIGCMMKKVPSEDFSKGLRALCRGHCLLHRAAFVRDLAAEPIVRLPLGGWHAQVAAGHILVVALFRCLGGLHALSDGGAICLPSHFYTAWVEVVYQTHQCGLVCVELLRRWREQSDWGCRLGLTCKG